MPHSAPISLPQKIVIRSDRRNLHTWLRLATSSSFAIAIVFVLPGVSAQARTIAQARNIAQDRTVAQVQRLAQTPANAQAPSQAPGQTPDRNSAFGTPQTPEADMHYLYEGRDLFRKGDFAGAMDRFKTLARLRPNNLAVHFWIGLIYDETNDTHAAMDEYATCLKLAASVNMDSPELRINLGNSLARENYNKQALFDFKRSLEIDKRYSLANLGLAKSLLATDDYDSAATAVDLYLKAGGNDINAYLIKGLALACKGSGQEASTALKIFLQNARAKDGATTGGNTSTRAIELAIATLREIELAP